MGLDFIEPLVYVTTRHQEEGTAALLSSALVNVESGSSLFRLKIRP